MATEINGTNLLVYIDGTAVAGSKTCKLSVKHDTRDCTTKDSAGWEKRGNGKRSWTISCDGLVAFDASNKGIDDLFGYVTSREQLSLKFSTTTSGDSYWYGEAFIDSLDIDAGNEESVGYSASFSGSETLAIATIT